MIKITQEISDINESVGTFEAHVPVLVVVVDILKFLSWPSCLTDICLWGIKDEK